MADSPTEEEVQWRQYALYTDLYKTYITAVIQLSAFVFAVSGGMVSYYLANSKVAPLHWSLLLPGLFNAGVTVLYVRGFPLLKKQHDETVRILRKFNFDVVPSYILVKFMLGLFGVLHALAGAMLLYLAFFGLPSAVVVP
jgi:hypothetical protein